MIKINEQFEAIDKQIHGNLKVKPINNVNHLNEKSNAIIVAEEIVDILGDAPIVLLKDAQTGVFKLSAIYGLAKDENLFINTEGAWLGNYIPVTFNMEPFGISIGEDKIDRIKINVNSGCISNTEGHTLFDEGQESKYLTNMRQQLESIIDASLQTDNFMRELVNHNLLAEFKVILETEGGEKRELADLYTINTEELAMLSQEDLTQFHKMNYLGPIYGMQQSIKQFRKLVKLHNNRYPTKKVKAAIHIEKV